MKITAPSPIDFYGRLCWLDGRPLLDTMETYRRELMTRALYTFRPDAAPLYNLVLSGRGKKNWKSTDLVLAAFYRLVIWESRAGNDCFVLANDEGQAGDDLALAKKLVAANPELGAELVVLGREIRRKDRAGSLQVLPAGDVKGSHGKTALFIGFDEIHGYKSWDIFEALAPDPTRLDTLTWVTSYDTIWNSPGVPLFDMKRTGQAGDDPRMLFSWYSGDLCTDAAFVDLAPEQRANPSMASWPEGAAYIEQQRRRLPSHKFRRLHLNLPGAPDGAFFDGDMVQRAVVSGVRRLAPRSDRHYVAFVDMSGGSSDDACLAVAHAEEGRTVLDLVVSQDGGIPFDPRLAVRKFARTLDEYGLNRVTGDAYAGDTFRHAFRDEGVHYQVAKLSKSEIYEELEPKLNAGEVELVDVPKLTEQLLTLVVRGTRVDHAPGGHDDYANAAAGAIVHAPAARPSRRRPDGTRPDEWAGGPSGRVGRPQVVMGHQAARRRSGMGARR
ncbi:MAG: hypothetical protein GEV13_09420 [Rhodospirillales bacterium]|nr:hypothetical protein [Rhodospirillales bacterium]